MQTQLIQVPLWRLAHSRTGDKGDTSNISVIAWNTVCWQVISEEITISKVAEWFAQRHPHCVKRYDLPGLQALNFVLEGVLDGGVNKALNLDAHGKALSFHLLDMPIILTASLSPWLRNLST